jgi:hypothetical protein
VDGDQQESEDGDEKKVGEVHGSGKMRRVLKWQDDAVGF